MLMPVPISFKLVLKAPKKKKNCTKIASIVDDAGPKTEDAVQISEYDHCILYKCYRGHRLRKGLQLNLLFLAADLKYVCNNWSYFVRLWQMIN